MQTIQHRIKDLPIYIQLYIDEYYNEVKHYYGIYVLPWIILIKRISRYYRENEFIYFTVNDKTHTHHYLINVAKTLDILNRYDPIMTECVLKDTINEHNIPIKSNIWLRMHITTTFNYFGGITNNITEILYINKYNFNQFALKIYGPDFINSKVYIVQPQMKINLTNMCNYYSAAYLQFLPDSAIENINHNTPL